MRRLILASAMVLAMATGVQAGAIDYFSESSKDFGTSPRGPVLTHHFTVTNKSGQPMTLGQPRVSCGCVSAYALKSQLAPGESTSVVAYMDTKRIPQANTTKTVIVFVTVQTANTIEEAQLRVTAIARDDLVLTPEVFAFGTVRKGQGGKVTTKITFYSDPNWKITDANSNGIYVKADAKPMPLVNNAATYEVTAILDPACPVGNWTADVWVKSTARGMEKLRIPVTVNVVASIAVTPEITKFPDTTKGKPTELKVILNGSDAFKILDIKGGDSELEVSPVGPVSRPVHILKLTLTPSKDGDYSKTLEITTDHADQKKLTVMLTGKVNKTD